VIGDGDSQEFDIAHGLNTDVVFVWVRQNVSSGLQLIQGVDFTVRITDANTVRVEALLITPGVNAWVATIMSAQTVAAFAAGLAIEIGQVNGLQVLLDAMAASIASLEALAPTAAPGLIENRSKTTRIALPERKEVYRGRREAWQEGLSNPEALEPGALLPAVHVTSITNYAGSSLPAPSTTAGQVYLNLTGAPLALPAAAPGHRPAVVPIGGEFASDGRTWYPVTRRGSATSRFATAYERELRRVYVSAEQLRAGGLFAFEFDLDAAIYRANTPAVYQLVIEAGTAPSLGIPSATASNLGDPQWGATPVLQQRIVLFDSPWKHHFGCAFRRNTAGTAITGDKLLYDVWSAADAVPASPSFWLRAVLRDFDVEDSVANPRGLPFYHFHDAFVSITNA
jgi:hypothetical protein